MDAPIYPITFEGNLFGPSVYKLAAWPHKNYYMHSICNMFLNLHESIHSLPLHLHVHLALDEEPFET
jgi:hypothetical protein